jgi:hypothetical protein
MAKTGRKPYETSDTVAYMGSESRRLRPPASLGERERGEAQDLQVLTNDASEGRATACV